MGRDKAAATLMAAPAVGTRRTSTTHLTLTKDLRIARRSDSSGRLLVMHGCRSASSSSAVATTARGWRSRLPDLSDTDSATASGAAAALVLAMSGLLASTGRVELGRGALAGVVLAIRPSGCGPGGRSDARGTPNPGLGAPPCWPGQVRVCNWMRLSRASRFGRMSRHASNPVAGASVCAVGRVPGPRLERQRAGSA